MAITAFDTQMIASIRKGDQRAIKEIYKKLFRPCCYPVFNDKGSLDDAREVFQEAFISLLAKLKDPDFVIKSSLQAYLRQSCFHIWLKMRRKSRRQSNTDPNEMIIADDQSDLEAKKIKEDRIDKLNSCIKKAPDKCRQLLQLYFFEKKKDKEIAPIMGYSEDFVKNKRRRCINGLKKCAGV